MMKNTIKQKQTFEIGNRVEVIDDFIIGTIVDLHGSYADVEFSTAGGGGCLPFELTELTHCK